MPTEIVVHAVHQGGMRVLADAGEHQVTMDYPIAPGNAGFTPLQLLLASLAGCAANTLAALLRKSGQEVRGLEVTARGMRREEHPTVFTTIALELVVHGKGVDREVVDRALGQAEQLVCPVWAMLKAGTPITASLRLVED
jgi:putative redox protein